MRRVLLATLVFALWHSSAQAQTCLGAMTFEQAPMRAGVLAAFSSESQTITGGVGLGNNKYFFGVGGVFASLSGFDDHAKGFFVNAGTERPLGMEKKYFVCPIVSLFKTWGFATFGEDADSQLFVTFGGTVGWVASTNGTTKIVPFGGLTIDYIRDTGSGGPFFGGDFTSADTFASFEGGVGIILNDKMVLTPAIAIPFGYEGDLGPRFSISFTTKVGR